MITPEYYQEFLSKLHTNQYNNIKECHDKYISVLGLGLSGETGEAVEHVKKYLRDDIIDCHEFILELGDVLAYVTLLAEAFDYTLEEVMLHNMSKLQQRFERMSQEKSEKSLTD